MTGVINRQPSNPNPLQSHVGTLVLKRTPNLTYFVQDIQLPGVNLSPAVVWTHRDRIPHPGDSFSRGLLSIEFKIDEDLKGYDEIYDWMVGLVAPNNDEEYARLKNNDRKSLSNQEGIFSDLTVILNNSSHKPNRRYVFHDCWPTSLSGLRLSNRDGQVSYVDGQVSFEYRHFFVENTTD